MAEGGCCCCLVTSSVQLFATPWTVAHQPPLFMGFPRQEYWSELPFSSLGDIQDPGVKPASPALQADYGFFLANFFFNFILFLNLT